MLVIGATGATPHRHCMRRDDVRSCAKTVGKDPNLHLGDISLKMKRLQLPACMHVSVLPCSAAYDTTSPPPHPPPFSVLLFSPLVWRRHCVEGEHPLARLGGKRLSADPSSVRSPTWAEKPLNTANQSAIQVHPPSLSFDSSLFSERVLHLTGRRVRWLLTVNQWQPRCD